MARNRGAGSTQGPSDEGSVAASEFPLLIAGKSDLTAAAVKRVPTVNADGSFNTTPMAAGPIQPISGTVTANQGTQNAGGAAAWPVQGGAAAGAAVVGNPVLSGGWDGTNAQTLAVVKDGTILTLANMAAIPAMGINASNQARLIGAAVQSTDGQSAGSFVALAINAMQQVYNGATLDRLRNNAEATLLTSAARTTTQTSADITTYNAQAIIIVLDMTVVGAGPSVTLTIDGKDTVSGKYYNLLTGTAVLTAITTIYRVDPALPAVANLTAQSRLPRFIRIVVTANNANSGTYSVGYVLGSPGG